MFSGQVFEFARHYEHARISVSLWRCRRYVKINHKNDGDLWTGGVTKDPSYIAMFYKHFDLLP